MHEVEMELLRNQLKIRAANEENALQKKLEIRREARMQLLISEEASEQVITKSILSGYSIVNNICINVYFLDPESGSCTIGHHRKSCFRRFEKSTCCIRRAC